MGKDGYLTNKQYLERLKILRKYIHSINRVMGYDSVVTGHKKTCVNVGLCNDNPDLIPKHMRMFPNRPDELKYTDKNQMCPLDKRSDGESWGCFFHCMFFKHKLVNKERILSLYNIKIEKAKEMVEDD